MPQIESFINNNNTKLGIWHIEESTDELLALKKLSNLQEQHFSTLKSNNRKNQWLATRILLYKLTDDIELFIKYDENGKPFLSNNGHISVSHSDNYVTIILSNKNVGIDIQTPKKNIIKAHTLFISEQEKAFFDMTNSNDLHLIWSAKEALFKYYGTTQNHLFTDFRIHSINQSTKLILGNQKEKTSSIKLNYHTTPSYYLVYTI